jgi:hypothetical protein
MRRGDHKRAHGTCSSSKRCISRRMFTALTLVREERGGSDRRNREEKRGEDDRLFPRRIQLLHISKHLLRDDINGLTRHDLETSHRIEGGTRSDDTFSLRNKYISSS